MTLAFIGHVPAERKDAIASALTPALRSYPTVDLELAGFGQFPASGRPRSLWVGAVDRGGDRLATLAAAVRSALSGAAVPFDAKPFRPHVTLARVPERLTPAEAAAIRTGLRKTATPVITLAVTSVALVESVLSSRGPRYTPLATFPLTG